MDEATQKKFEKVKILYERTNIPGEKAAAYEALKRMQNIHNEDYTVLDENWFGQVREALLSKGFWNCCTRGNSYIFTKDRGAIEVWVTDEKIKGNWRYFKSVNGRRVKSWISPTSKGTNLQQLISVLK